MLRHISRSRLAILSISLLLVAGPLPAQAQVPQPPGLVATPGLIDFGDVTHDTVFQGFFRVKNVSDATITISSFSRSVPQGMSLSVDNGCIGSRPPGAECSVRVEGSVRTYGTHTATLTLPSDDPQSPLVMRVRATYPAPIDKSPPVMGAPLENEELQRAFRAPKRKARFVWSWWAQDDKDVTGFKAQLRSGNAKWRTVVKPSREVPENWQRVPLTVPTGRQVTLRVRAFDAAGNKSKWVTQRTRVSYRDIRPSKSLKGDWMQMKARSAYGGTLMVTGQKGATASITVKARGIALLGRRGPNQGAFEAYVSDGTQDRERLHARKKRDLQVLHTWYWPNSRKRTITIETWGGGWDHRVSLDAWVVLE